MTDDERLELVTELRFGLNGYVDDCVLRQAADEIGRLSAALAIAETWHNEMTIAWTSLTKSHERKIADLKAALAAAENAP